MPHEVHCGIDGLHDISMDYIVNSPDEDLR
jgi:hypothetical protein